MFSVGSYAKLWEIKEIREKYSEIRISTSRKTKEGKYEQDFGGFARCVGQAHDMINGNALRENDTFKIIRCGVSNSYDKERKTSFCKFVIYELETQDAEREENPFLTS